MTITARSENRSIVDLDQVLIHFISQNDNSASPLVIVRGQVTTRRRYMFLRQVLIKGCLEAPNLLPARVFSIYVPHF